MDERATSFPYEENGRYCIKERQTKTEIYSIEMTETRLSRGRMNRRWMKNEEREIRS